MTEELKHILEKVEDLYSKYGIKSVTMDDIAKELGMSKKTLYQFVEDRHDLVKKVIFHSYEKKIDQINSISNKEKSAIQEIIELDILLHQFISEFSNPIEYDLKKYFPDLYNEIKTLRKNVMKNVLLKNIQKGKQQGIYRSEIMDEIIAEYQSMILTNLSDIEIFSKGSYKPKTYLYEIINYHLHAIVNEKGLKQLNKLE